MRMKLSCVKIRNDNSEFITIIKIYILMDIIFYYSYFYKFNGENFIGSRRGNDSENF